MLGWTCTELELGKRKAQFRKKTDALVSVSRPALKANVSITIIINRYRSFYLSFIV